MPYKSSLISKTCWIYAALTWLFISAPNDSALATGGDFDFRLPQAERFIFAVIGDYGLAGQAEAEVANLVKGWDPNIIVTVGDNNYPIGAEWSIDENIGQYFHEYIYPYLGEYGEGAAYRRFYPALGNHDWTSNQARPFFRYFGMYNEKGYYEFVQGPVHFFILDSDPHEPDGVSETSKQAKWLKNSLSASSAPFKVVVTHHPPFSSGRHGSIAFMQWPFEAWGADAVMSGHDHSYERIQVGGIPYFINGIGGGSLYEFDTPVPGSQVRFNQDFGAMRVEVASSLMRFQAYTRTGLLIDEHTISNSIPVVTSITRQNSDPTSSNQVAYKVTFSEPVSGVDVTDFSLTPPGSGDLLINDISGTGDSFLVSISTLLPDGGLRLDLIDDDSIRNAYGTPLGGSGLGNGAYDDGQSYTIDKTPPSITSITRVGASPTSSSTVDFNVTFSEPVTGVDIYDFACLSEFNSGAWVTSVSGAGQTYVVSAYTGNDEDILRVSALDDDTIQDLAGNMLGGAARGNGNVLGIDAFVIDRTPPVVIGITRMNPDPSSADLVEYMVVFSEAVLGVDGSDFGITAPPYSAGHLNSVEGGGSAFMVSIYTGPGDTLLRLDVLDNDTIVDLAGNPLGGQGPTNGDYYGGETYTIDKNAPTTTSITRTGPETTNLTHVEFAVTFSEHVLGVDETDFILSTTGIPDAAIVRVGGSGNSYIVSIQTGSLDGTIRLDLIDDDTIVNEFGDRLGDSGVGNGNFSSGDSYIIDRTPPTATSIIRGGQNPSGSRAVDFIVTFSEPVTGVDPQDFIPASTSLVNVTVNSVLDFNPFFVVNVNSGMGTGALRLDLADNNTIKDLASNTLGGSDFEDGSYRNGEAFDILKNSINYPPPAIPAAERNLLLNMSTPTLKWTAIRGAQAYEVVIGLDLNFNQIAINQVVPGVTFTPSTPLSDGAYYWHVRAYNSEFQPGKFSYTQLVRIDTAPPPAPGLVTPADQAVVSTRLRFSWEKVADAGIYRIEIDDQPDFSSVQFSSTRKENHFQIASLPKASYFWRVQSRDAAGNWSEWSVPNKFTIP